MCGIVGYIGHQEATPILINGLKRLEYRGYDSAGVAILNGALQVRKKKGKVKDLDHVFLDQPVHGTIGIGHTRWATHGVPNDVNAHPHLSNGNKLALVHNGIIENYATLREGLTQKGYVFHSQTDTEVLVNLIDEVMKRTGLSLEEAVPQALSQVTGAYGIAIIAEDEPNLLIAARNGSPLILGIGENEYYLASDASAFIEHTKHVVYLNDGEVVTISREGFHVKTIENVELVKEVYELEWELEAIEKGGYDHFMLKEIMGQPESIRDCLRGRINLEKNEIHLGGLVDVIDRIRSARRIIIAACGTSWHAGLVGEYLIESLANIPVEVEYASEFRYRNPILFPDDVVLVISQSGETADTLAAVREAKHKGALALGIVNAVGSTIARETDAGVYLHAGPEIGVASTKAFTAQVAVLAMLALHLGQGRTLTDAAMAIYLRALQEMPEKIAETLKLNDEIKTISKAYRYVSNFLFMGRGYNFPVALEGALKLKEISYIHAEGYPSAEMKHGPIALIDEFMPVVMIAMKDSVYEKVVSNIEEIVARKGKIIAITDEGNHELDNLCEYVFRIPASEEFLTPLLTVIPLQLLSYHVAVFRGCNVDQPRNLAKSVTVE
jgi:glucosamine--fructose-6-phosphate aminotransferase (isomerizing)